MDEYLLLTEGFDTLPYTEVRKDFFIVLSEIERAQSEITPHSLPVTPIDIENAAKEDKDNMVFSWVGKDAVSRNLQMNVDQIEDPLATYTIQVHAWQDFLEGGEFTRYWQHAVISQGQFYPFWSNHLQRLKMLEDAYTRLSTWTREDLNLKAVLPNK